MKYKGLLRCIAFILLLTISVSGVLQCYGLPRTYDTRNIAAFDAEKDNLVDGIILGTSVVSYSWLTPMAWKNYGLSIYHLGTSVQPFGIITDYLDYVNKSQDIKYVIIDIHGLRTEAIYASLAPAKFGTAYLNIPDFASRISILKSLYKYAEEVYDFYGKPEETPEPEDSTLSEDTTQLVDINDKSYFFPFLNFHSRWVDGLKKADYVTVKNIYMGADDRDNAFKVKNCSKYKSVWKFGEVKDIDDFQKSQLQNIFDYAKENDLQLLFINMPSFRTRAEQEEMRNIIEYCKNQGYNTIDFANMEMIKELNIDLSTDFINRGHLNSAGGVKVTNYICEYLIENDYYSVDHRGDPAYSHWDTAYEEYNKFFKDGWSGKNTLYQYDE